MKSHPDILHSQHGFILAATVWVLAAVTLGAGFFCLWADRAVESARLGQEDLQHQRDMISTRSILLYLLGTQSVNYGGLTTVPQQEEKRNSMVGTISPLTGTELALTGRVYQGFGSACFSMQDEGGLLGLNVVQPEKLGRLLGVLGVPAADRRPLIDKLLDYTDSNELHRLNGAEAQQYRELGLPPPANRPLLTSWEARNVLDWGTYEQLWEKNPLPRLTTVVRGGGLNCNTAPSLVLQSYFGIDEETVGRIIDARQKTPLTSVADLIRAAGKPIRADSMELFFVATPRVRLTIWADGGVRSSEIHVYMTPVAANGAPWLIDHELPLPHTGIQQDVADKKNTGVHLFATPLFAGERQGYSAGQ